MSDALFADSWWLLSRARGVGAVLRILVLTSPLAAVGCTWLAAGRTVVFVDVLIVALAVACTVRPDSHFGLPLVVLVGVEWLTTVHDRTSPWSIGTAISLAVLHTSMAAASVAPPTATWTPAMCRRWTRRCAVVMVASAGTWAVVVAVHTRHVGSSAVLVAATLLAIAVTGLWARSGTFDAGSAGQAGGIAATRASTNTRN